MFRTWKSVLAAAANESFAESVVDGQKIKTDEGAAAPSRSSVTGAAVKHKRTMDKFLALRIVYGKGPKS